MGMRNFSHQTKKWWSTFALIALCWTSVSPAFVSWMGVGAGSTGSYYAVCTSRGIQVFQMDASGELVSTIDDKAIDCPICQSHHPLWVDVTASLAFTIIDRPRQSFFGFYTSSRHAIRAWQHPQAHAPPLLFS